jgi:5-methylcytosine-specific restriction endonuclease McrA
MRVCTFPACGRRMSAAPWCAGHNKQHRQGKPLAVLKQYDPDRGCAFPGCQNAHRYHGYCDGHGQQLTDGRPLAPLLQITPIYVCTFPRCGRSHEAHGLCQAHNWQREAGKKLTPIHIPNPRQAELTRQRNRRARKRNAEGGASADSVQARWDFFGRRCVYCRAPATETDHKVPLALGGTAWAANLVPACRSCNARKGDMPYLQWIAKVAS